MPKSLCGEMRILLADLSPSIGIAGEVVRTQFCGGGEGRSTKDPEGMPRATSSTAMILRQTASHGQGFGKLGSWVGPWSKCSWRMS